MLITVACSGTNRGQIAWQVKIIVNTGDRQSSKGSLGAQQTSTCIDQGQVHHLLSGTFCGIL